MIGDKWLVTEMSVWIELSDEDMVVLDRALGRFIGRPLKNSPERIVRAKHLKHRLYIQSKVKRILETDKKEVTTMAEKPKYEKCKIERPVTEAPDTPDCVEVETPSGFKYQKCKIKRDKA